MPKFLHRLCFLIVLFLAVNLAKAQHSNCPVAPYPADVYQPNGTKITLVAHGTEAINYLETTDGYTVLKNADGYYMYAVVNDKGHLAPSEVMVNPNTFGKAGLEKHLRYSQTQVDMLWQMFNQQHAEESAFNKAANPNPFPPTGNRKVLVLLIEYPDLPATISLEEFEVLLNQPNAFGIGSVTDYYQQVSNGKLNLTHYLYGWMKADSNYQYYGKESSPNYGAATRELLLNACRLAEDSFNVNFKEFDNDNDGFCDAVVVIHSGIGAEESTAPNSGDYIWSFRNTLGTTQRPTYDSVQIASYAFFPEKRYEGGAYNRVGIGVICHEFGHILDLPDLYSTQYLSRGAGNYTLMSGGGWLNSENTPCFNDAWSRVQMGWVTPTIISDTALFTLPKAVVDSDMVFRINTSRSNEYYLLENRQKKKADAFLPSDGLAIWHINSNRAQLLSLASSGNRNNVNNDTSQLGVGLIQADGQRDLERNINGGDEFDLYPINNNRNFAPASYPRSNLHFKISGVKQPSNISITDIVQLPDSSIVFELGMNASAAFTTNRVSGCGPLSVLFTSTATGGDSVRWDFANGITSDTNRANITYQKTGAYNAKLRVYKNNVLIDSSERLITVNETPEINYDILVDTGYYVTLKNKTVYGSNYNWTITTDSTFTSFEVDPTFGVGYPRKFLVKVSARSNDNCSKSRTDSVQVFTLGVNGLENSVFKGNIFPNPVQNQVNVTYTANQPTWIEIFDVAGKLVHQQNNNGNRLKQQHQIIDVANLPSGLYFIKLTAGNHTATGKFIKQ